MNNESVEWFSPENYFVLYGAAVVLVIFYLMRKSSGPKTVRLKLSQKGNRRALEERAPAVDKGAKSLNVVFNFNGHSWDAYEVLGLPAGSPWTRVEQAYKAALRTVQPGSEELLRFAFEAIRKQLEEQKKEPSF